jgi:hypothetical protein
VESDHTGGPAPLSLSLQPFFFSCWYIYKRQLGGFKLNYFTQRNQQRTLQRCFNSLTCELTRAKFYLITISYRGRLRPINNATLVQWEMTTGSSLLFYVPFENSSKSCPFSFLFRWRKGEKKRGQQAVSSS